MSVRKAINFWGGILILGAFAAYGIGFWRSLRAVDGFCTDVGRVTRAEEIAGIAESWGVKYSDIVDDRDSSRRVGFAASPYTMGDYACRVRTANGRIISSEVLKH